MLEVEYEATFTNIDKNTVRELLRSAGAKLVRAEFLQRRSVFHLPSGHEISGGWLRVRDEGDRITMSLKIVDGDKIEDQKELSIAVDDYANTKVFLESIGASCKSYQETKRELWILDGTEIAIDEWPYLEPFVEIEGDSEESVRMATEKIGFDYSEAVFCQVSTLFARKYGIEENAFNDQTPLLTFESDNPFI